MDTITAITTGLSGINATIEFMKGVSSAKNSLNQAELTKLAADTMMQLSQATIALSQAQTDIIEKGKQIEELKAALETRGNYGKFGDCYYEINDAAYLFGSPNCLYCFEKDGLARHLVRCQVFNNSRSGLKCPHCKTEYRIHRQILAEEKIKAE